VHGITHHFPTLESRATVTVCEEGEIAQVGERYSDDDC
jgi:hypothetical protein